MKIRILTHKWEASAPRQVRNELVKQGYKCKRYLLQETTFIPFENDMIVNWGCIKLPDVYGWEHVSGPFLNHPDVVRITSNRLQSLTKMKEGGVRVPAFTTDLEEAREWLDDGFTVLCREKLRSFGGRGIKVVEPGPDSNGIVPAALYTRYIPKRTEFRVHVFRGKLIELQQKKRRLGQKPEGVESKIRSYDNGWIFCRQAITVPAVVVASALDAVAALALDFAAVDVGWTEKGDKATVYECNSAPGIEGETIIKYANAIKEVVQS